MSKITQAVYDAIIAQASREAPNECCGLLAGNDGVITQAYPICNLPSDDPRIADLNIPADRRVRYMMDPAEQFRAMKAIRAAGLTLMGIYHSHPHSEAYPSATDIRLAFYSDLLYIIVSLAQENPNLRAFWMPDGKIKEEKIDRV